MANDPDQLAAAPVIVSEFAIETGLPGESAYVARYRIEFVDHGNNVYWTFHAQHDSDEAAIADVRLKASPNIGAGFDIWHEDELVHQHRQ